jgi:branched-chain amino acid transport system permease protein
VRTIAQLVVVGLMLGSLYGLLGFTLTLMFRSTGVLSFAHAGFALIGSYLYSGLSCPPKTVAGQASACSPVLPPWQAATVSIIVTTIVALLVERLIMRPLQDSDTATKSVATAAVLGLSSGIVLQIFGTTPRYLPADQGLAPAGGFRMFGVTVDWQRALIFAASVVLVALVALFLRRSWFGLGVRAAGQLPEEARLMGIRPAQVSRFNWALGGALAGLAGVLIAPIAVVNIGTFSFLLVKAVAAGLLGGLVSLPLTFVGGIGIGLVEAVTPHFWERGGSSAVGIAALYLNRRRLVLYRGSGQHRPPRTAPPGRFALGIATWLRGIDDVRRRVPTPAWIIAGLVALSVPLRSEFYGAVGLNVLFWALLALSLVLVTGSGGQPSLMQMGFAGIGAYSVGTALHHGLPFAAGLAIGVAACLLLGLGVGYLALQFRGVEFAIVTLTVAAAISDFVLTDRALKSTIEAPELFGLDLVQPQHAFLVMLVFAALAFLVVHNVRRFTWGRSLGSLREESRILAHFGVDSRRAESLSFAISSAVAGLAGATYALMVNLFGPFQFIPLFSITVLLVGVVGGLRSLWGPVIAGLIFGFGPTLVQNLSTNAANAYPQIFSSLLALVLVVGAPDGLASLFAWSRSVTARAPVKPAIRGYLLRSANGHGPVIRTRFARNGRVVRLRRPEPVRPARWETWQLTKERS